MIKHLQIETTNICNAHCVFCPHDRFEKFGTMPDALYEKIIKDASRYDLKSFSPMLTGEPFCDPRIMYLIKLAREKMPKTQIRLFTNGSLIKRGDIDALAKMGNVEIWVSLNGACRDTRQKLMGLHDFDAVKAKIDYMVQVGLDPRVSIVCFPIVTWDELGAFGKFHNPRAIRFQSFAGENYRFQRKEPTSCNRVTEYITVMQNGNVNLCCFDPFGKVIFGNLGEQTIAEVWNSPLHEKYMRAHQEGRGQEMELCRSCTEAA